ncbi:MAG: indole-3-glycerol-phosphate synthase [Candidatus Freyarchaeota archaeon]
MPDHLDILARDAFRSVKEKLYETTATVRVRRLSLREAILKCGGNPVISELKFSSPSLHPIRAGGSAAKLAADMEAGGSAAISVLTEPKHFRGHPRLIPEVRKHTRLPILMKDIVVDPLQVEYASRSGANAVLLIQAIFDRGYCELDTHDMIRIAHKRKLEVLLEVHTEREYLKALETDADLIGINNRDLKTLRVSLEVTRRILSRHGTAGRIIVSMSGISAPRDITYLRSLGAKAFLVGTAIMKAKNVREKMRTLVEAQ